jgi:phosphoribosylamine--glycine ligase
MNVLVIGSGGREHVLTWKIAQSDLVKEIYCAPGNPGMASHAKCVAIGVNDQDALLRFSRDNAIDLVVVGPEDPLANGIVDRFAEAGIKAFGPTGAGAILEASKSFTKDLMKRYGIPSAEYAEFDDAAAAKAYVEEKGVPIVIKANGLAAGKGVCVAHTLDQAIEAINESMVDKIFGDAGSTLIIEECLFGEEASILAFTDGKTVLAMAPSQDHKPAYDGDKGPNTGGMGAYCPAPVVDAAMAKEIERTILQPCVDAMAKEDRLYRGILYAGLMMTDAGPKVIEFNCRFGDPEAQVVLPRLDCDIVPLMVACCDGTLADHALTWRDEACVTVVMASGGYPKAYEKGKAISGIEKAEEAGLMVFQAGTKKNGDNIVTAGGRVLNVTALGQNVASAIDKAYEGVPLIHFDEAHYRTDIGQKAIARR